MFDAAAAAVAFVASHAAANVETAGMAVGLYFHRIARAPIAQVMSIPWQGSGHGPQSLEGSAS
jgi:hypothetical protein